MFIYLVMHQAGDFTAIIETITNHLIWKGISIMRITYYPVIIVILLASLFIYFDQQLPEGYVDYIDLEFENEIVYQVGCNEPFSGVAYSRYGNKQLIYEDRYVNGKLHGICKAWYSNGQLMYIKNYEDGIPCGTWKGWTESGEKQYEKYFDIGK